LPIEIESLLETEEEQSKTVPIIHECKRVGQVKLATRLILNEPEPEPNPNLSASSLLYVTLLSAKFEKDMDVFGK